MKEPHSGKVGLGEGSSAGQTVTCCLFLALRVMGHYWLLAPMTDLQEYGQKMVGSVSHVLGLHKRGFVYDPGVSKE